MHENPDDSLTKFPAALQKPSRIERFKADENAATPDICSRRQEFPIIGKINCGLTNPFFLKACLHYGAEQVLGVCDMPRARSDGIVNRFLPSNLEHLGLLFV